MILYYTRVVPNIGVLKSINENYKVNEQPSYLNLINVHSNLVKDGHYKNYIETVRVSKKIIVLFY